MVEDRTEFVPVGRDSSVTVDDHDIEAGRCVGQQSGQSRPVIPDTLDTRPLVGVGRDMLPVAAVGRAGQRAGLPVGPAGTGLHDRGLLGRRRQLATWRLLSSAVSLVRRPLYERESKAKPVVS